MGDGEESESGTPVPPDRISGGQGIVARFLHQYGDIDPEIRRMQYDLFILGYWGFARFLSNPNWDHFDDNLVGAVLGFKWDLIKVFQIPCSLTPEGQDQIYFNPEYLSPVRTPPGANLPPRQVGRDEARDLAKVDPNTARYIRTMVDTGVLNFKGVFRMPLDAEIETFSTTLQDKITELLDFQDATIRAKWERTTTSHFMTGLRAFAGSGNIPFPLTLYLAMTGLESGGSHTFQFNFDGRSHTGVIYGVDWNNSGGRMRFTPGVTVIEYNPRDTPEGWVHSRGWGLTQATMFNHPDGQREPINIEFPHRAGQPFSTASQEPIPSYVRSAETNLIGGMAIFLSSFINSTQKFDCSYLVDGQKYRCRECLCRFTPNPFPEVRPERGRWTYEGLRTWPAIDLEPIIYEIQRGGETKERLLSYAVTEEAAARLSVSYQNMEDRITRGSQARNTLNLAKGTALGAGIAENSAWREEWPCSWVRATMAYAGQGPQAWGGTRNRLSHIQRGVRSGTRSPRSPPGLQTLKLINSAGETIRRDCFLNSRGSSGDTSRTESNQQLQPNEQGIYSLNNCQPSSSIILIPASDEMIQSTQLEGGQPLDCNDLTYRTRGAHGPVNRQTRGRQETVSTIQRMLQRLGDLPRDVTLNPTFDEQTQNAVRALQGRVVDWQQRSLGPDGGVGYKTGDALNRAMVGLWYHTYTTPIAMTRRDRILRITVTEEYSSSPGIDLIDAEGTNCRDVVVELVEMGPTHEEDSEFGV